MNYSDVPAKLGELRASHGFLASVENSRVELVPSPRLVDHMPPVNCINLHDMECHIVLISELK